MLVSSRVFVVTGASSGLGLAVLKDLLSNGARAVLALDMDESKGAELQQEYGEDQVLFQKCDVCDSVSVSRALRNGIERLGSLHGLVQCAGVGRPKKLYSKSGSVHDMESFEYVVRINLFGTFNVLRLFVEQVMLSESEISESERAIIINVASIAAFEGQIGQASYSASKAAIVGMTLPLARELAAHRIRVMTIAPGIFETPMMAALPPAARASLNKQVPFPARLGDPSEFAHLCRSIIENPYLNGETIRIDGSIRMSAL